MTECKSVRMLSDECHLFRNMLPQSSSQHSSALQGPEDLFEHTVLAINLKVVFTRFIRALRILILLFIPSKQEKNSLHLWEKCHRHSRANQ